jgi:hypothetical protein
MPKRYKGKRRARPLAARAARKRLDPSLAKDVRGQPVRYAVESGVLWSYYADGSREQARGGFSQVKSGPVR